MATYYDLIMRCPHCIGKGESGGIPSQWYHSHCGGKLRIGDDAYFSCTYCGHSSHIRNWRYRCENHSDHRQTSSANFAHAVSISGQLAGIAGRLWLMELLNQLGDF